MKKRLELSTEEIEKKIKNFKTIEFLTYATGVGLALTGYVVNNPDLMLSGMAIYQSQTNMSQL
jgi:hypothetical protein